MIKLHRIAAMLLRYLYIIPSDFGHLTMLFFWPLLNLVTWGFSASWIAAQESGVPQLLVVLLCSSVLWQLVIRANFDVSVSLLEELSTNNVMNLFSTPLQLFEWVCAIVLLALMMMATILLYCAGAAWLIYGVDVIGTLGLWLPAFLGSILFSGLTMGLLSSAMLIAYGIRTRGLVFMMAWIFAPLSGVFYSIEVMPQWVQAISHALPMTYIFAGMRQYVMTGQTPVVALSVSYALNVIYFFGALALFKAAFEYTRSSRGLAKVE